MTKLFELLHGHISAARSHLVSTREAIIKKSATNILVRQRDRLAEN